MQKVFKSFKKNRFFLHNFIINSQKTIGAYLRWWATTWGHVHRPKEFPWVEKQCYFWRETQFLPSSPKAKDYITLFLAFPHGPPLDNLGTLTRPSTRAYPRVMRGHRKKMGVVFEPLSDFSGRFSKIPRKTNVFCIILKQVPKNYQ